MQKELRYNGYTAVPSDYESLDGDLAASMNAINEDNAIHPVLPPTTLLTLPSSDYHLHYIHTVSPANSDSARHYIISLDNSANNHILLYYYTEADRTYNNAPTSADPIDPNTGNPIYTRGCLHLIHDFSPAITLLRFEALGNTLVVITDEGMFYFLWSSEGYKFLGNHMPECTLTFSNDTSQLINFFSDDLYKQIYAELLSFKNSNNQTREGNHLYSDSEGSLVNDDDITKVTDAVMAALNKYAAYLAERGILCNSFEIRYAYRLFDGSLTMHSAPIQIELDDLRVNYRWEDHVCVKFYSTPTDNQYKLKYQFEGDVNALKKWKDIISSIDIFISAPFYSYDTSKQVKTYGLDGEAPSYISFDIPKDSATVRDEKKLNNGRFYLIHSIRLEELTSAPVTPDLSEKLQSIVTRELMTDDYDSHDLLNPTTSFVYNQRLNIANISKRLFDGFNFKQLNQQSPSSEQTGHSVSIHIYTVLSVDGKEIVTKSSVTYPDTQITETNWQNFMSGKILFYYPNTKATEVYILCSDLNAAAFVLNKKLQQHENLNGAVTLIEGETMPATRVPSGSTPSAVLDARVNNSDPSVLLPNKIYTSEVGDPYFFPLAGINTVGTGEIIALAIANKAFSPGQHGDFPLYIFTTNGVCSMKVNDEGLFSSMDDAVTQDVCLSPDGVLQLDNSVLFATDRGIMMLSGSTSVCMTDDINDPSPFNIANLTGLTNVAGTGLVKEYEPFLEFVKGCRMLYDYTHQRVIVYNPATRTENQTTVNAYPYAYVYSLKSKQWGMMRSDICYNVNAYPRAFAMREAVAGNVATVAMVDFSTPRKPTTGQPLPDDEKQLIVTRPLKLDAPDILKTINTIIQRGYFQKGKVQSVLYASRDLMNWFPVWSSVDHYLRGYFGTPYKYFRIALICELDKTESIFGCSIDYAQRLTNQLR